MNKYVVAPGAIKKIERAMGQLSITAVNKKFTPHVAAQHQARFYMTPVRRESGEVVWFKATLRASPGLGRGLREETRVQHALADYEQRYHPGFDSPAYIQSGDHGGFLWLMRKYWQGSFAGDMDKQFGASASFLQTIAPAHMAAVLTDVRAMTGFMKRRIKLVVHDAGWYQMDFHFYRQHFFRPLLHHRLNPGWSRRDVDQMERIFLNHRDFIQRHANVFAHGDMYPNNIMVRPGHHVVLFDWELTHLNLPTFDATMMYLHAWRQPAWQKSFRAATIKALGTSQTIETSWNLTMLSLAIRLTAFCFIRLTNSQPERFPRLPAADRPKIMKLYRLNLEHLKKAYSFFQ